MNDYIYEVGNSKRIADSEKNLWLKFPVLAPSKSGNILWKLNGYCHMHFASAEGDSKSKDCSISVKEIGRKKQSNQCTILIWSDATAIFSVASVWGQRLLFWKAHRRQWQLDKICKSHTVMTVRSYVQLPISSVGHGNKSYTQMTLALAWWPLSEIICTCARVCAMYTSCVSIRGWHLFCSELPIVRLLFHGGIYLKKYSIRNLWTTISSWR